MLEWEQRAIGLFTDTMTMGGKGERGLEEDSSSAKRTDMFTEERLTLGIEGCFQAPRRGLQVARAAEGMWNTG